MSRPVIGIIGLGKVGRSLCYVLNDCGYEIGAIYNRTADIAYHLSDEIGVHVVETMTDVAKRCDLIILSVSDDAISVCVDELQSVSWEDKAIIHVSGASSIDVFDTLQTSGAMVGSLHPAFPFSDVATSRQNLFGATFAIEYHDNPLRDWLKEIIESLNGQVLDVPSDKKSQYHLALVMASNYMVTLYATAESLLTEFSDDDVAVKTALTTIMSATMDNLVKNGIPMALTGPLVRADVQTLQAHVDALQENPLILEAYINLAKLSYPMLVVRGIDITQVDKLLKENSDASDNT